MNSSTTGSSPVPHDVETAAGSSSHHHDDFEDPTLRSTPLKPLSETTPRERVAGGVAALAVATSLVAAVVEFAPMVLIAGALSSVMGSYAYYQQTQLTDIRTLQETHNAAKEEVTRLVEQNHRLQSTIQDLQESVTRLEDVEAALDAISETQGRSVNTFSRQVQENKDILASLQSNLKSNVLHNILNVILRSDKDRDHKIDEDELNDILQRIQSIKGVDVNVQRFRDVVHESDGDINAVMKVLGNLFRDDVPESERIFTIWEE